jgi:hypothetical protein
MLAMLVLVGTTTAYLLAEHPTDRSDLARLALINNQYSAGEREATWDSADHRPAKFPRTPASFIETPFEEAPFAYPDLFTYVADNRLAWETGDEDEIDRQFRPISGGDFRFQYLERHKEFPVRLGPVPKAPTWDDKRHEPKSIGWFDGCWLFGSEMSK